MWFIDILLYNPLLHSVLLSFQKMVVYDPLKRITAKQALDLPYFDEIKLIKPSLEFKVKPKKAVEVMASLDVSIY